MTIKFSLLALATLLLTNFALAGETHHSCDLKGKRNGVDVYDCIYNTAAADRMEVEVPDTVDGGTKLIKVNSAYSVRCNDNQRCAVTYSDTIKTGAVIGNGKPGTYRLNYDHYIDFDANGTPTQYLRGTGPHYGGAPAAGSAAVKGAKGAVTEASCAPQMDDDCTVNKKKVAKADLGKYLPVVNEADVRAAKGFCEYPICYNADNQPIGISK